MCVCVSLGGRRMNRRGWQKEWRRVRITCQKERERESG